jgi:nuclear polyadenylated RNA-binding protein NAB2
MRNGNNNRGGRDRRVIGHMNKAMDRSGDSALHRVRGQTGSERINTHGRTPPSGPRGGAARNPRGGARAANIQHGLQNMAAPPMMMGGAQAPMDVYQILEQQNQMMFQLSQQLMNNNGNNGNNGGYGHQRRGGKSLFDRVQDPHRRKGQNFNNNHHNKGAEAKAEGSGEGEDVDMGGSKRDAPNPEDTVCKYNLNCTNRECKFAHQSPAAPHGAAVDVNDPCSFGAACKNRKCVGRHPSPATKLAHQSEQDCKFFPNCQNPRCPFRHPSMPLCRNGPDCSTPNCKFTHVKTKCKFNPCLNPTCAFVHDEGQQGGFKDKVWTAENPEHVSERKFVGEDGSEELVRPEEEGMKQDQVAQDTEVIG